MELKGLFSRDPAFVIKMADKSLSSEPVLHNLILSILHSRIAQCDPGRCWIALYGEEAVGVVVQSPLEYPATLTRMEPRAVLAIVDAIAEAGVTLAGVNRDAACQGGKRMSFYVLGFQDIDKTKIMAVGGKGGNLGEISKVEGRAYLPHTVLA